MYMLPVVGTCLANQDDSAYSNAYTLTNDGTKLTILCFTSEHVSRSSYGQPWLDCRLAPVSVKHTVCAYIYFQTLCLLPAAL